MAAGALPPRLPAASAALVPPVGWRVAGTVEVLSCPALVGRPALFHWPDEGWPGVHGRPGVATVRVLRASLSQAHLQDA